MSIFDVKNGSHKRDPNVIITDPFSKRELGLTLEDSNLYKEIRNKKRSEKIRKSC